MPAETSERRCSARLGWLLAAPQHRGVLRAVGWCSVHSTVRNKGCNLVKNSLALKGLDGRKNTPLLCLTLAMASLGVSWAGRLRVRHSHDGLASGRASETRGCPLAGRDLHGNPLHTDLCFWRLLLALCAIATPEAVLGECVAVLLRQWIEPRRRLHR